MANYTPQWTLETPGGQTTYKKTFSGGLEVRVDESIPDSTTDQLITLSLDVSAIQCIDISSDQDITVETNNASSLPRS